MARLRVPIAEFMLGKLTLASSLLGTFVLNVYLAISEINAESV